MELLLAIAVLAILVTLAVPSFTQFIQNNRLAGQANEMVAAFQFARSEALKRGVWADMCASADGESCGGSFADGWIVETGPAGLRADETNPLRVWSAPGDDLQFDSQQSFARFLSSGCFDHDRDGACSAPQSDPAAETPLIELKIPECPNDNLREILISRTGRVSSNRVDCP